MLLHTDSCSPDSVHLDSGLDGHHTPCSNLLDSAVDLHQEGPVGCDAVALPSTPTSVRTVRPFKISRSRTSCLNRSSSNAGGGFTRERAADRSSPATLDRLTPRHPAISIDAARSFNPGSKSSIPWRRLRPTLQRLLRSPPLRKGSSQAFGLHLDVVRPLDPGPQRRTEPLEGAGSGQTHEIGTRVGGTSGSPRTRNEIHRPIPRGESQRFPPRPFPAVWQSAVTTVKWAAPASASTRRRSFVEGSSS